jgi:hypothetical protein
MNITIDNANQFHCEFQRMGRGDQFSYEALGLLFDYFEEIAPDMALDVIAVCCEYSEGDPSDIAADYLIDLSEWEPEDEVNIEETVVNYLREHTSVVGITDAGTIVYAQF